MTCSGRFGLLIPVALCATVVLPFPSASRAEERTTRRSPAYLTDRPPTVDGVLSELVWAKPATISDFVKHGSDEPASPGTLAWAVYDSDALYLAIRCEESEGSRVIHEYDPQDTGSWSHDDTLELFLDPGATRSQMYQFILNADGKTVSGMDTDFQNPLDHEAAGTIGPHFWSVEVRIPFTVFGCRPSPGDEWGLNICRTRQPKGEEEGRMLSTWSRTQGFQKPENFGLLRFVGFPGAPDPAEVPDLAALDRVTKRIRSELGGDFRWGPEDVPASMQFDRAESLYKLGRYLTYFPVEVLWSVRPALSNVRVYPWTVPSPHEVGAPVRLTACRGEFEPATFVLFPLMDLYGLEVETTEVVSASGESMPGDALDLREVKCWYQSGSATMRPGKKTLIPELLLHDPSLVLVDPEARENTLNFQEYPRDAAKLQPTEMPAYESRQFLLAARIPEEAEPGVYRGSIVLRLGLDEIARIPLEVTVLDFDLEPSPFIHSLYYTRRLKGDDEDSLRAQMDMMAAEIRNQVDHGINAPSTYVHPGSLPWDDSPWATFEWLCRVHREAGVPDEAPFLYVTFAVGTQQEEEALEGIRKRVRQVADFLASQGRPFLYVQGKDEAPPSIMREEREAFQAVHDGGGHVFVACGSGYFDVAGDLLDLPVVAGTLKRRLARKVHDQGYRIAVYANPFSGMEKPDTYRRNYGLRLWLAGYDGAMNWEYGRTGVDAWNDFERDSRSYNNAYPALGCPIDTLHWEGWREGVDDLRYLATLLTQLAKAERQNDNPGLTGEIREWLGSLEGNEDLDRVRRCMIEYLKRLGN